MRLGVTASSSIPGLVTVVPALLASLTAVTAVTAVTATGCGDLKDANDPGLDGGAQAPPGSTDPDGGAATDGGTGEAGPPRGTVTVATLAGDRDHVGARSGAGFRPWRSGIAASGGKVYWVESGTAPGLYAIDAACTGAGCTVATVAPLTRPAAFHATAAYMYIADTSTLKQFPFTGGPAVTLASAAEDIVNIGADPADTSVFWTSGDASAIRRTLPGGGTDTPINSNGTPVAMGVAGTKAYWAGCDISGLTCYLQAIGLNGTGVGVVGSISGGFHVLGGNDRYVFYAEGQPAKIHRKNLASGKDDIVDEGGTAPTSFAVDASYAYWAERGDAPEYANGRVVRIEHASKSAEVIAESVPRPVALAVSGTQVFVASAGSPGAAYADGKILRYTLTP